MKWIGELDGASSPPSYPRPWDMITMTFYCPFQPHTTYRSWSLKQQSLLTGVVVVVVVEDLCPGDLTSRNKWAKMSGDGKCFTENTPVWQGISSPQFSKHISHSTFLWEDQVQGLHRAWKYFHPACPCSVKTGGAETIVFL